MYARQTLFILLGLLVPVQLASAITAHRGTHTYLALLGSRIKFPIFTKEFTEGADFVSVGGVRQLWLPDQQATWGLRLQREHLRPNGSGLGLSLTYWRGEFADEAFLYDAQGPLNLVAEYRNPVHTYLFLDLNGAYLPWESGQKALGLYALIGLVGDREEYDIDRYALRGEDPRKLDLSSRHRHRLDLRFNFGLGSRLYLSRRFSLWIEKRWIVGERFTTDRTFSEGGFFAEGQQKTLYVPINSLGLAVAF
jgi:hypothetical protein